MEKAVILSACRTAGGKFGGQFKNFSATDLGAAALKEAVLRSCAPLESVEEVILGNGWQAGVGANPARNAMYKAGVPVNVPAFTVNIRCGSGLRSVMLAADRIRLGDAKAILAGGMESATNTPYLLPNARWGFRMGKQEALDALHADGFQCPLAGALMGEITEDYVIPEFSITREEQDEFSYYSHKKAAATIEQRLFKDEIVPVILKDKKKGEIILDTDEIPRKDISMEALAKLPTIFKKDGGTITAGSSSALCDAGSAVFVAGAGWAKANGLKPMAEIMSYAVTATDPQHFPIAPVDAMRKALDRAGMSIKEMELIELNEAFAAQVIACRRIMPFDMERLNVHGGAISLGHPIGASGAKILTTLIYSLIHQDKEVGMASACIGGGQAVAMVVKIIK
ncbi:MAG: acetyl-CoA C-acyltransferase [Synergistes jonesii]|uniref:thiolase family protein n=1 Tax=Synergistes jonesii TaxID=2754 RepID=UPI002A74BB21|nr:acetyl-CoA C-acyltransferase [Synergistes jonesii]MDY2984880.1 acetyl-CoA C-acyltransferase [Synergistes jonesii]